MALCRLSIVFRRSGRQDLNLRPPGPQRQAFRCVGCHTQRSSRLRVHELLSERGPIAHFGPRIGPRIAADRNWFEPPGSRGRRCVGEPVGRAGAALAATPRGSVQPAQVVHFQPALTWGILVTRDGDETLIAPTVLRIARIVRSGLLNTASHPPRVLSPPGIFAFVVTLSSPSKQTSAGRRTAGGLA
jgi:hypothetical protein